MKPLRNLVVVELGGSVAGAYCAKMFANGGAAVSVVGRGNLTRSQHDYLRAAVAPAELADIDWSGVDVCIESSAPDPLTPIELNGHDHLVRVQISPFGQTGERAHWRGTDLTDYALGGHSYLYGHPEREPLRGPPNQPAIASGLYGFIGAMAALIARDRLSHGQLVEIAHQQVMVALHQVTLLRWFMNQDLFRRMGNRYTGQGQPNGIYPCKDGWISVVGVTTPQVEALLAVTGLTHLLGHPDIETPMDFQLHPQLMDEPLRAWFGEQNVAETVELFQAMRIPSAPVLTPLELLTDPQLIARDFFQPLAGDPNTFVPGQPFTYQHHQPRSGRSWQPGPVAEGPLAGLKVLDLARVWAGPLCARTLSDLGAEVVWVEAPFNRGPQHLPQAMIDSSRHYSNGEAGERPWNRNGHLIKYSLGKDSLALDLQTPEGQQAFERLVPHYHVLLENFSPRVMPQFGLGEDRLHELNPDLIYLTMPGYGRSGPAEQWLAYGSSVDSHAGLSYMIGYPDQVPWKGGVAWPDPIAGLHAASAVLSTLWAGLTLDAGGVTIEAAQFESTVAAIGDQIVTAQQSPGTAHAQVIHEGVYRCLGDDEWIAVSVPDEATLQALCISAGIAPDPNESFDAEIFDQALSATTASRDASELSEQLQSAGVPAAKVAKAPDLVADPHLASRSAWVTVDQPDVGAFTSPITPISLSTTMPRRPRPAPTLGEHNHATLLAAGFATDEIAALETNGIIVTQPPN